MDIKADDSYIIKTKPGPIPSKDGLGWEYFRCMKKYSNRISQILDETGEEQTFADLLSRSIRVAIKLKSKKLPPDAIISLCSENHKDSVVPFIAAKFVNINFAAVDPLLSTDDLIYLLGQVTPHIIFVSQGSVKLVEDAISKLGKKIEIVVFGEFKKYDSFSSYLKASGEEGVFEPEKLNDCRETAIIFFSSGTTGLPKGICLSHYGLLAQAQNLVDASRIERALYFTTLYWISAEVLLTGSILDGQARIIASSFDPRKVCHIVDKYQVGMLLLSPYQFTEVLREGKPGNVTGKSLKSLITGGGPISKDHILLARSLLPNTIVYQAYGQTEVAGCVTTFNVNNPEDVRLINEKPSSSGRPLPGLYYKVVDPDTEKILGPGEEGELRLKSDYFMIGYYNRDSTSSYDSEGWLKTGDIVCYDEDFCFYVVDRIKEMLKYQGWHVPPAVVENVFCQHPAVSKAIVIGIPHDVDGDHLMGIVILNAEYASKVTTKELEDFVNEKVSERQKIRAGVRIINEIPLTPSGKVKRKELRNMVMTSEI